MQLQRFLMYQLQQFNISKFPYARLTKYKLEGQTFQVDETYS